MTATDRSRAFALLPFAPMLPLSESRGFDLTGRVAQALHHNEGLATISQNTPVSPRKAGQPSANQRRIVRS